MSTVRMGTGVPVLFPLWRPSCRAREKTIALRLDSLLLSAEHNRTEQNRRETGDSQVGDTGVKSAGVGGTWSHRVPVAGQRSHQTAWGPTAR